MGRFIDFLKPEGVLTESFQTYITLSRKPGVHFPLIKNATTDEIDEIIKADKRNMGESLGVRIGMKGEDIYYWSSDILHISVEKRLQIDFDKRLVWDKRSNTITDYSSGSDTVDITDEQEAMFKILFPGVLIKRD